MSLLRTWTCSGATKDHRPLWGVRRRPLCPSPAAIQCLFLTTEHIIIYVFLRLLHVRLRSRWISHCHPSTLWIASPSCTINSRLRELLPEMPPSISPIIAHYIKAQGTESPTLLSDRKHRKPVCTFSLSSYSPSIFIRPPAQHRSLQ